MSITIIESNELIDIDLPFRVAAGPGAGKTYWLTQHIHNVVRTSDKLFITKKVLSLTYTNNAVKTLRLRLGNANSRVEVMTIHSFFYSHIVKPYISVIAEEFNLDVTKIDGHDDKILSSYTFLKELSEKPKVSYVSSENKHKLIDAIKRCFWHFNSNGNLVIKPSYPIKVGKYNLSNATYLEYKKLAWEKGTYHHDDIIFFAYQIINKVPFISKIISEKFPYIFIDEFQDSTPLQINIFRNIAEYSIVGVIGDQAQSIYGFQGAKPTDFQGLVIDDIQNFQIVNNHRSSNEIISFLNIIRQDLVQKPIRNISDLKPIMLVGDTLDAHNYVYRIEKNITILSRSNIVLNLAKAKLGLDGFNKNSLEHLTEEDSNPVRSKLISSSIRSLFLVQNGDFKEAIKELQKNYPKKDLHTKKLILNYLVKLSTNFEIIKEQSLLEFSKLVADLADLSFPNVTRGKVKTFYEDNTFISLYLCVKAVNEDSHYLTVHKAKGNEFDNVLLLLSDPKYLAFITDPDLTKEEQRINYVAVSRAKNKLFICVPTLEDSVKKQLLETGILDVVEV